MEGDLERRESAVGAGRGKRSVAEGEPAEGGGGFATELSKDQ